MTDVQLAAWVNLLEAILSGTLVLGFVGCCLAAAWAMYRSIREGDL